MTRRELVALVAAVAFVACSRGHLASGERLDPRRIVSVDPATTEALFAVGAGDRAVGRSRFCDWPPEATKLPTVGGFLDVDLERVVSLRPDLVIGAPGPASARLSDWLNARGISTYFPQLDSFASIEAMILELGARTQHVAEARRVVSRMDSRTHEIDAAVAKDRLPRVLMVFDASPPVAAGPKSFADEMIQRAHAVNVVIDGPPWQAVGMERIVELDPDLILDASMPSGEAGSKIDRHAAGWADVRAVREGRVISLSDERVLRPGPRVAEGLAVLAHAVHPDAVVADGSPR